MAVHIRGLLLFFACVAAVLVLGELFLEELAKVG